MTLVDQVSEVVPVVGGCDFALGDAQTRLKVLTDSVGHRLRRETAPLEFLRPPAGKRRPRRALPVLRLNPRDELALFRIEPSPIAPSSRDGLNPPLLHSTPTVR